MKHKNSKGDWIEISIVDALTPEYIYDPEVIGKLLSNLVEKKIFTFDEAITIIGEFPKHYKVD